MAKHESLNTIDTSFRAGADIEANTPINAGSRLPAAGMSLLVKLGSIAVHAEEFSSPGGHEFDLTAIKSLLSDLEVSEFLRKMDAMALLPKKRK